ncbi:unnamed protein product [Caenorhabditis auriculariae]|uniref:Uncharacterized protein n=1 Tax=Caenorhabditis auriculariae TaxID=2777116 RepID=A0A8S1GZL3_9PELO|nr:unnamed protein product [Caenorhabditis auriculariae]
MLHQFGRRAIGISMVAAVGSTLAFFFGYVQPRHEKYERFFAAVAILKLVAYKQVKRSTICQLYVIPVSLIRPSPTHHPPHNNTTLPVGSVPIGFLVTLFGGVPLGTSS